MAGGRCGVCQKKRNLDSYRGSFGGLFFFFIATLNFFFHQIFCEYVLGVDLGSFLTRRGCRTLVTPDPDAVCAGDGLLLAQILAT